MRLKLKIEKKEKLNHLASLPSKQEKTKHQESMKKKPLLRPLAFDARGQKKEFYSAVHPIYYWM